MKFKEFITARKVEPSQMEEETIRFLKTGICVLDTNPIFYEETETLDTLNERQQHDIPVDPPAVLVMRRKSIRQFPDGQRVALYFIDKLNKYISVPYEGLNWAQVPEERKSVFPCLYESIRSKSTIQVEHVDGSFSEITPEVAYDMLNLYRKINDSNKQKMKEMLDASAEHFNKITNFSKE